MRLRWVHSVVTGFCSALLLVAASRSTAQVTVISPLPNGIAQVHDSVAHVRVRISLGTSIRSLKVALLPDTETIEPYKYVSVSDSRLFDSLFIIPRDRIGYSLYWDADSLGIDLRGSLSGVTPGHVFAIAGQSNAEGRAWEMNEPAVGDIRMLRNDGYWERASEPTGTAAGGPWIVMANRIFAALNDTLPVGIVNAAAGGTSLLVDQGDGIWACNRSYPEDPTTVYGKALHRFREAGAEFEDLCWIQGESDGCCDPSITVEGYQSAFLALMDNFSRDLGSSVKGLHLQVSGQKGANPDRGSFPILREALRTLPHSTLVGTAVGRSLTDGLHYSVPTEYAVGKMFGDAYITSRFGRETSTFPPLDPDTLITIDSIRDGSIPSLTCITVRWRRGSTPTSVIAVNAKQYFALESQDRSYDTSQVSCHVDPFNPTVIRLWLRTGSIDSRLRWWVTYIPTPGAEDAPIATISGRDTLFATAFYQLPAKPGGTDSVPFQNTIADRVHVSGSRIYFLPFPGESPGRLRLYDVAGQLLAEREFMSTDQTNLIDIAGHTLLKGLYFVQLFAGSRCLSARAIVP